MFTTVWRFTVRPDSREQFERDYGREGRWAALFRTAPGYVGTDLYRSVADANEYVTIDRWSDEAAYRRFRDSCAGAYDALDRELEHLTTAEEHVGTRSAPRS